MSFVSFFSRIHNRIISIIAGRVSVNVSKLQRNQIESKAWRAHLAISFELEHGQTRLRRRHRLGPVVVQKPFYPHNDNSVHVYLVHPPGGIAGGDELNLDVCCRQHSQVLLTTPGAAKFYRSQTLPSLVRNHFSISSGACLEYFPQENIFYPDCQAQVRTQVELQDQAQFMTWDISSYGSIGGKQFSAGQVWQKLHISRQDEPLFVEGQHIDGSAEIMQAAWGLQGNSVVGNFVACLGHKVDIKPLQDLAKHHSQQQDICSVSQFANNVLVARFLGQKSGRAKAFFSACWSQLRPYALNRDPVIPRIWYT